MMYCLRLLRCNSAKAGSTSQLQVRSYLSQTLLAIKSTPPRASNFVRDVRTLTASKIRRMLRSSGFEKNGKTLAKESSRSFGTTRLLQTDRLRINTDVINNVYLYKYEKPRFFKIMNMTAGLQLVVWSAVAYSAYEFLPKRDSTAISIVQYLREHWFNAGLIALPVFAAIGGSFLMWIFISRSIRSIILNKGGKTVTLVTYRPFDKNIITVPVNSLKCRHSRSEMGQYMPIKMHGRRFFYILDKDGEFINPTLFDYTVGEKRS